MSWTPWIRYALLVVAMGLVSCGDTPTVKLGAETVQPDEAAIAASMSQSIAGVMQSRGEHNGGVLQRFNQAKSLGCFDAQFDINSDLPQRLAQGLFARPASYPAKIRVASASTQDDRDKDIYGFSVSVAGLAGRRNLTGGDRQDFVLNSYPALFAADPSEFLEFVQAVENDRLRRFFLSPLNPHLGSLWIVLKARSRPGNPFAIRYFSTTPFRHGADTGTAVKYAIQPCTGVTTRVRGEPGENHLSEAMAEHLNRGTMCFDFMIQFQTDAEDMPIEDASVIWSEDESAFLPVAKIQIAQQSFLDDRSTAECERMSFNPWNALPAHQPLGGINRVRKSIYTAAAAIRDAANTP